MVAGVWHDLESHASPESQSAMVRLVNVNNKTAHKRVTTILPQHGYGFGNLGE